MNHFRCRACGKVFEVNVHDLIETARLERNNVVYIEVMLNCPHCEEFHSAEFRGQLTFKEFHSDSIVEYKEE